MKTETIRESAPGLETLYAIDDHGTLRINWEAVETLVITKLTGALFPSRS